MKDHLITGKIPSWCPGCFNFQIFTGVKNILNKEIAKTGDKNNFAIVSGIGCHGKIFDGINLPGIHTLHGRVLPTCLGLKIGNPNLTVLGFSGDGDAYAEGGGHLFSAARYNADFTYIVHNNQVFALTVGQPTPTSETGFKDKTTPQGVKFPPINPIKLMLAAGATFVARVFADTKQVEYVLAEALKHKGFAFIEVIQPCIIFHPDIGYKEKIYSLEESGHDKTNYDKAWKKSQEFDYNIPKKIPVGIFYQEKRETFEDHYEVLKEMKKNKTAWKDIKR